MLGGTVDVMAKALLKKGRYGKSVPKTLGARELRNFILANTELWTGLESLRNIVQAQGETVKVFVEGTTFTECPTCRGATAWTLMKHIPELLTWYERA